LVEDGIDGELGGFHLEEFQPIHDEFEFLEGAVVDVGGEAVHEFARLGDDGGLFDSLEAINFALLLVNQFFAV
jgi:hypothetical protein